MNDRADKRPVGQAAAVSRELEWICRSTLQATFPSFREAEVHASFYPYLGLTHTIRRRGQVWIIRISDHCAKAPRKVLEAISLILGCKILRRKPPESVARTYESFRLDPSIAAAVEARRAERGRKVIGSGAGRHHSLDEIFREVNQRFFNGQVEVRKFGWGPRLSWSRLGHYDPIHHTITVSPVLDSPRVPRWVVAYIVYHEMLHTLFGHDAPVGQRRRHHPADFRLAERAHPDFEAAKRFLSSFCRRRRM